MTYTDFAPLAVERVALTVRDLDRLSTFYQRLLGFEVLSANGEEQLLGLDGHALLALRQDRAARPYPHGAGLFHTAFLLPDRADLGRWLRYAVGSGLRLTGASDHLVSEALYLRDPEGNGIEIYADRPRDQWLTQGHEVVMDTVPLDLDDLAKAPGDWQGAPRGMTIGHVHLQVGDIPGAEAFYADKLGLDVMARVPQASFYASGGYHHHIATNTWNSAGAGPRAADATGLSELVLGAYGPDAPLAVGTTLTDPWGNSLRVEAGAIRNTAKAA